MIDSHQEGIKINRINRITDGGGEFNPRKESSEGTVFCSVLPVGRNDGSV